jgi:predicted transcriptional regulator
MTQKPMFSFRLSKEAIYEMDEIARDMYIPVRTMARQWIMQRLDAIRTVKDGIPATGADIGVTTPGTDGHQTQGAGADGS